MQTAALVTGSSRGIGRAVALELARQGWDICVNYHERADAAAETVDAVRALGRRAVAVRADVSDRAAVSAMVDRCRRELGEIGVLVNNAGVAGQALFQDVDDALWDHYFGVNLQGARNTVQAVLPAMLHEKRGSIVNISSIWSGSWAGRPWISWRRTLPWAAWGSLRTSPTPRRFLPPTGQASSPVRF